MDDEPPTPPFAPLVPPPDQTAPTADNAETPWKAVVTGGRRRLPAGKTYVPTPALGEPGSRRSRSPPLTADDPPTGWTPGARAAVGGA